MPERFGTTVTDAIVIPDAPIETWEIFDGINRENNPADVGDDQITGGLGRDLVFADGGNDTINGRDGDDDLYGGLGNDSLTGGKGNDFLSPGVGDDTVSGGDGNDTVTYSFGRNLATSGVTVNLGIFFVPQDTVGAGMDTIGGVENAQGSRFGDKLIGNLDNNILRGQNGDDSLIGGGGNDTLFGGWDNDLLEGGVGDDIMDGDAATGSPAPPDFDTVTYANATAGVEVSLATELPQDTKGAGVDTIIRVEGLIGSAFNDKLYASNANTTLEGGAGDDQLSGTIMAGRITTASYRSAPSGVTVRLDTFNPQNTGGAGTDTLFNINGLIGSDFGDNLTGNNNANRIEGLRGRDTLTGGLGDDTYVLADVNFVGSIVDQRYDTVVEAVDAGVDTVLITQAGIVSGYTLAANVDNGTILGDAAFRLTGNSLNNLLLGNGGANTLRGAGGEDAMFAGLGDDDLFGGDGKDSAVGGGGSDALNGEGGDDFLFGAEFSTGGGFAYEGATGADVMDGGEGNDGLWGGGYTDNLKGGAGDDSLVGGEGGDTLDGGVGNDFLFGGDFSPTTGQRQSNSGEDVLFGGEGDDALYGFDGNDNIIGDSGNDYVEAGPGNDNVYGGADSDTLLGDAGDDLMHGGAGFDYIYGGGGADRFLFMPGDSYDTIWDFSTAHPDKLLLAREFGVTTFEQFIAKLTGFTFEGADYTVIDFPSTIDRLTIKGVAHTAWTESMVEFQATMTW